LRFNCGSDDSIVAKDLFRFIWIGRFATHADASGSIIRQFGAAKAECVGNIA
jgi:hypothetical protein